MTFGLFNIIKPIWHPVITANSFACYNNELVILYLLFNSNERIKTLVNISVLLCFVFDLFILSLINSTLIYRYDIFY